MNRGPGGAFERPKRRPTQVLRRLFQYFRPHLWLIVLAVVLSVAGNILSLVSPRFPARPLMPLFPATWIFRCVLRYVLLMILCAAASALMSYLLARLMVRLSRSVVYQMRKDLFQRLGEMPVSFFDTHQTGDVISVYSYDVDTVNASFPTT